MDNSLVVNKVKEGGHVRIIDLSREIIDSLIYQGRYNNSLIYQGGRFNIDFSGEITNLF